MVCIHTLGRPLVKQYLSEVWRSIKATPFLHFPVCLARGESPIAFAIPFVLSGFES